MTRDDQGRSAPAQAPFRQLLRDAAELMEMLWSPEDGERSQREEARRKRAFDLYRDVLRAAEDVAVTRARLTSRPHPPSRTVQMKAVLTRQTERRDRKYRALSALLNAQLRAPAQPPAAAFVQPPSHRS